MSQLSVSDKGDPGLECLYRSPVSNAATVADSICGTYHADGSSVEAKSDRIEDILTIKLFPLQRIAVSPAAWAGPMRPKSVQKC